MSSLPVTSSRRAFGLGLGTYIGLAAALLAMIVLFSLMSSHFLSYATFTTLANQIPDLMVLATGMTFILIIGGIDLSVGSVVALAAALPRGAPVVPAATDSGAFWGRRAFAKRPGTITVSVLPGPPGDLPRAALLGWLEAAVEAESARLPGAGPGAGPGAASPPDGTSEGRLVRPGGVVDESVEGAPGRAGTG